MEEELASGPPVPVQEAGHLAVKDDNCICQAISENGTVCGESESLRIIKEFQLLYEERLRGLEDTAVGDVAQLKIKTLMSWINDLGEQNSMLVQTVEQLEREAADRVALLEERLQRSSHIALEYMTKLQDYDSQIEEVTGEKVESEALEIKSSSRLIMAQQTEGILRKRVGNLQNDIAGLLELIRRARQDGAWDLDGIHFVEVTYEDVLGSCPYQEIRVLHQQISQQQDDLMIKDTQIKSFVEKIKNLRDNISRKSNEADKLVDCVPAQDNSTMTETPTEAKRYEHEAKLWKYRLAAAQTEVAQLSSELQQAEQGTVDRAAELATARRELQERAAQLQSAERERQAASEQAALLAAQLHERSEAVSVLSRSLVDAEKASKDMREALTAEVAEKHDQALALRHEVHCLEERLRQADMQTHFKDDIIKEMRKDIRLARAKEVTRVSPQGSMGEMEQKIVEFETLLLRTHTELKNSWDHIQKTAKPHSMAKQPETADGGTSSASKVYENLQQAIREAFEFIDETDEKMEGQSSTITSLKDMLKKTLEEVLDEREKSEIERADRSVTLNQEESKRRIAELQLAIKRSKSELHMSLWKARELAKEQELLEISQAIMHCTMTNEEDQINLEKLRGEMNCLVQNLATRGAQIKTLEAIIAALQESLTATLSELDKAQKNYINYLLEREKISNLRTKCEENFSKLNGISTTNIPQLENLEEETWCVMMKQIKRHSQLIEDDQAASKSVIAVLKDLLGNIQHYNKMIDDLENINKKLNQTVDKSNNDLEKVQKQLVEHENTIARLQLALEDAKASSEDFATVSKTSVGFTSITSDQYEQKIQELQKELKEAQNAEELAKKQPELQDSDWRMHAAMNFSKQMAEYRLKTVIAQAAVEEIKNELDNMYDNFKDRDKKIKELEMEVLSLQKTVKDTKDKLNNFLQESEGLEKPAGEGPLRETCMQFLALLDETKDTYITNELPAVSTIETLAMRSSATVKVIATQEEKVPLTFGGRRRVNGEKVEVVQENNFWEATRCYEGDPIRLHDLVEINSYCEELENFKYSLNITKSDLEQSEERKGNLAAHTNEEVQELVDCLQLELRTLNATLSSKEKVIEDQREMLAIQQQTLTMSQNEVKDLQEQLKKFGKPDGAESKQVQEQQTTIAHLQTALLAAKQQLEELRRRGALDLRLKDGIIKILYLDLTEMESQYRDCYGEVVKQALLMEVIRDTNVDLKVDTFYLRQEVEHMEVQLAEALQSVKNAEEVCETMRYENKELKDKCHDIVEELITCRQSTPCVEIEAIPTVSCTSVTMSIQTDSNVSEQEVQTEEEVNKYTEMLEGLNIEIDMLRYQNMMLEKKSSEEYLQNTFYSARLRELKILLDTQTTQGKRNEDMNQALKLNYESAVKYCKEMEDELKRLKDILLDYHGQIESSEEQTSQAQKEVDECKNALVDLKERIEAMNRHLIMKFSKIAEPESGFSSFKDNSDTAEETASCEEPLGEAQHLKAQVLRLQSRLQELEDNYCNVCCDCRRYQAQLLEAAHREVMLQHDYTAKESYLMQRAHSAQEDSLQACDSLQQAQGEVQELQGELSERDAQLQSAAASLRALSQDTSRLQEELETKNVAVQRLQDSLSRSNVKLIRTIENLNEKDHLIQNLNKENTELQKHLRNFETQHQNTSSHAALQDEAIELREEIQRLVSLQEKSNIEKEQLQETLRCIEMTLGIVEGRNSMMAEELEKSCNVNNLLLRSRAELGEELANLQNKLVILQHTHDEQEKFVKNLIRERKILMALLRQFRNKNSVHLTNLFYNRELSCPSEPILSNRESSEILSKDSFPVKEQPSLAPPVPLEKILQKLSKGVNNGGNDLKVNDSCSCSGDVSIYS